MNLDNPNASLPASADVAGSDNNTAQAGQPTHDYEQRFNDTRKQYREVSSKYNQLEQQNSQLLQEIEALKSRDPVKELLTRLQPQPQETFWSKPIDQHVVGLQQQYQQHDQQFNHQSQEIAQLKVQVATHNLEKQVSDLYETTGKTFGFEDKEAFKAYLAQELPKLDPKWNERYLMNPSQEVLSTYLEVLAGRLMQDPNSLYNQKREREIEQRVLAKFGNRIGGANISFAGNSSQKSKNPYSSGVILD